MKELSEIFSSGRTASEIIDDLRGYKSVDIPSWGELLKDYEESEHEIIKDRQGRQDKIHEDGTVDRAARIAIPLEKRTVDLYTDFTFAIPVKRVYSNIDGNETRQAIADAIEKIYTKAHIDTENMKRGHAYYASCEVFTQWYVQKKPNNLYGFQSEYKLKCKSMSPMSGFLFWPLFDETGDMLAMSYEYKKKVKDETVQYFETFTATTHYQWTKKSGDSDWELVKDPDEISIGKIPGVYWWRNKPVYAGTRNIRSNIEYKYSRNSDVVDYNAAPIIKVAGALIGEENKGETRRIMRVTEGGDVSYVSWDQAVSSVEYQVKEMFKSYFMATRMPDISFTNLTGLGQIGYDARRTLFMDAHLKIREESGPLKEYFEREDSIIKSFLKQMNKSWENEIDNVYIEHIITPYIIDDEKQNVEILMKANGNKPLIGHRESVEQAGLVGDVDATMEEFSSEEEAEAQRREEGMKSLFSYE